MSKRGYVSRDIAVPTAQAETPVSLRLQGSATTVKAFHARLPPVYRKDEVRLVRRTTVLLALLVHHVPRAGLCERWGRSASCLSSWQRAVLLHGLERWPSRPSGGRRPQLTPRQTPGLVELREAGPQVGGGRPPVGPLASSGCCSGARAGCSPSASLAVRDGPPWGLRFRRRVVCRIISPPHAATHGATTRGPRCCGLPNVVKAGSALRMQRVVPRGAR